ncbi:hypothetical protein AAZX31_03G086200 [Glycine max]|uniref:Uncharacterized protein n=2 Tax=Glycine subgen. Soja TaxID=1462606 RepID=I1JME9_SOYBN|nr:uncharacterized protein LOC100305858 precursor [Glycine max]XP_028224909.1 uncharacterized protein LOC114406415 [Glycine soja]KAH1069290.1 hypothetical protein GYH30_006768 [Glycine max]KAH1257500.1 hypothetical protein GmHk_03G007452 [Glycine max]KHN30860.1 hypothetical protein glysoja_037252 [Glycine soja]KRH66314.1 hypothetical protein GLYMA_03G098200v4 [Glycine max]|eukprot:NP_001237756.2 uncharacterized protein LOC100305858 precursor [Glycine max]
MVIATRNSFISLILISSLFCTTLLAKSSHPISDAQVRKNKLQCYADIDSGLWGWSCKSTMIARENCALRCLSPACYELIYESDPLEEGEKDFIRSQEYKYCMHKLSMGESLEGVKGAFSN